MPSSTIRLSWCISTRSGTLLSLVNVTAHQMSTVGGWRSSHSRLHADSAFYRASQLDMMLIWCLIFLQRGVILMRIPPAFRADISC